MSREIFDFIETILLYKFPKFSREEIEAMFSLSDLKQTRVYQEAKAEGKAKGKAEGKAEGKSEGKAEGKAEGKLEAVPVLLALGLSVEQIAEELDLDVQLVRQTVAGARRDS